MQIGAVTAAIVLGTPLRFGPRFRLLFSNLIYASCKWCLFVLTTNYFIKSSNRIFYVTECDCVLCEVESELFCVKSDFTCSCRNRPTFSVVLISVAEPALSWHSKSTLHYVLDVQPSKLYLQKFRPYSLLPSFAA